MTELNTWKPVDASNPIPRPTNERQVLVIYKHQRDNKRSRAYGISPYISIGAHYELTCDEDIDPNEVLYWEHGCFSDNGNGPIIYNPKYNSDTLYCITEIPPIPAPTASGTNEL